MKSAGYTCQACYPQGSSSCSSESPLRLICQQETIDSSLMRRANVLYAPRFASTYLHTSVCIPVLDRIEYKRDQSELVVLLHTQTMNSGTFISSNRDNREKNHCALYVSMQWSVRLRKFWVVDFRTNRAPLWKMKVNFCNPTSFLSEDGRGV